MTESPNARAGSVQFPARLVLDWWLTATCKSSNIINMNTDTPYHELKTTKLWHGTKRIAKVNAAKKYIPFVQYIDQLVRMDDAEEKERNKAQAEKESGK